MEKISMLGREWTWTRRPAGFSADGNKVEIVTVPRTDLWQRTYYGFCNDNAPLLQTTTDELYFSFTVRAAFSGKRRFDQCGVVVYIDGQNWIKGSTEREDERLQRLGSVVTVGGYSDWASVDIPADVNCMWYRLSRRGADFCIECSRDGVRFSQMRICHIPSAAGRVPFGIYACSPEDSSFTATFDNFEISECRWAAHAGQPSDGACGQ